MPRNSKGTKCTKGTRSNGARALKLSSGRVLRLSGLTSPARVEWVEAKYGDRRAYAQLAEFHRSGPDASRRFAENGVVIVGSADWALVMKEVAHLTKFPMRPLIERPGWSGSHYALPDGRVYSPRGTDEPIVIFTPDPLKCLSAGTGG